MSIWFPNSGKSPRPDDLFFIWSRDEHSVGVTVFDQEHQKLAALMCRIHSALKEEHDRDLALNLLEALMGETQAHFDHEERAMMEASCPGREEHVSEHEALHQEVESQFKLLKVGSISALAIPNFLKAWLIPHMQKSDRKYASYLRRHGFH